MAFDGDLSVILSRAIPTFVSFETLSNVVQANAEGLRVKVTHSTPCPDDAEGVRMKVSKTAALETELFVKRIIAAAYAKKSWADLRRTLIYARTEVRFYNEVLPMLEERGLEKLTPKCFDGGCDFTGLINESESSSDVNNPPASKETSDTAILELEGRGAHLVLQSLADSACIRGETYYQQSPVSPGQASQCLAAVAKLHATGWENVDVLKVVSDRLGERGGSYHLSIRNPKELQKIEESWGAFRANFEHLDPAFFGKESVKALGRRILHMADFVSKELSPSPSSPHATIVHGDLKAMNVFLPNSGEPESVVLIDYASTGLGLGMSDVAMFITHALEAKHLRDGGEECLIDVYIDALETARQRMANGKAVQSYARELALRHYRLATVDYCRFIMGRFWNTATPASFEKNKANANVTLVNRDAQAAMAFVDRADRYLQIFEEERAQL